MSKKLYIVIVVVMLVGAGGYLILARKSRPVAEQLVLPSQQESEKESTYNLVKNIAQWNVEDPAGNIQIQHCADGTARNSASKIFSVTFGPVTPGTAPSVNSLSAKVRSALENNGWKKCTPSDKEEGSYYSNIGPWFRETYAKDSRLLQLNDSYSMGTGDQILLQFEYRN